MEPVKETLPNELNRSPDLVDVVSGKFYFHNTPIENASQILTQGIASNTFAERAGLRGYKRLRYSRDEFVYLTREIKAYDNQPYMSFVVDLEDPTMRARFVGRDKELPHQQIKLRFRIPPDQLLGIVARGHDNNAISQQAKELETIMKGLNLNIPVYDKWGNLLWPKQMTHEQIVEELRRKGEIQSARQ